MIPSNFAQLLVNGLAVGGGFLVGYMLAWAAMWWADRSFLLRKTPPMAHRVVRFLGGLVLAIIVALLVFGAGGSGLGGGTGENLGDKVPQTGGPNPDAPPATVPAPVSVAATTPSGERVRVTLLGGPDVKDERFYLVDADPVARNFAEVKSALAAKKADGKKLVLELRFAAAHTLPQDHPAVARLAAWARDSAGLTVTYPAEGP